MHTSISVMSFNSQQSFHRRLFADQGSREANQLLRLLLAQDGSTTRLCEAAAGGPVSLRVLSQQAHGHVPAVVRLQLPGERFIERITFLAAHGEVLMDNLAYIALEGLDPAIETVLLAGTLPIGHLLARMWVRREAVADAQDLPQRLWDAVGLPDPSATRCYRIVTPEGPRMLIAETYRRGMRMATPPRT
ncbi:chorismate--pyruvate lyase [Burkholderiaceae bacterium]|nr:chorismate--pyruvate lyase [Burkholderiaceae bacterium]